MKRTKLLHLTGGCFFEISHAIASQRSKEWPGIKAHVISRPASGAKSHEQMLTSGSARISPRWRRTIQPYTQAFHWRKWHTLSLWLVEVNLF